MSGVTGDPLDRIARHAEFDRAAGRVNRIVPIDELLALVEVARAARGIADCEDYWDWVTGYVPALKVALARLDGPR